MPDAAQQALAEIFAALHIRKVVCIDDAYASKGEVEIEQLKARIKEVIIEADQERLHQLDEVFPGIAFDDIAGPWNQFVEKRCHEASPEQRRSWAKDLGITQGEARDIAHLRKLNRILTGVPDVSFRKLSPDEWQADREAIISECSDMDRVLFFFDEDFSSVGLPADFGLTLLAGAIQGCANRGGEIAYFGLLSHKFGGANEPGRLAELSETLRESQVLPISKERLDSPLDFAHSVKIAVMGHSCKRIRAQLAEVSAKAQETALTELENLSVWDFHHIVLVSSQQEGVWEFDTLHRVYALLEKRARLREALSRRETLDGDMALIRHVRSIKTRAGQKPSPEVWSVRHSELFEEPGVINGYSLPLELGDLFRNDGGRNGLHVLVAQPCDLMLRSGGHSTRRAVTATLVPVQSRADNPGQRLGHPEVSPEFPDFRYFHPNSAASEWHLNFGDSYDISLDVLDLAAFNKDGECAFHSARVPPSGLLVSSQRRYSELQARYDELDKILTELKSTYMNAGLSDRSEDISGQFLDGFTLRPGAASAKYSPGQFQFSLRRVGRLAQPYAGHVLRMYAAYQNRFAVERDYAKDLSFRANGDSRDSSTYSSMVEEPHEGSLD